MQLRTGLNAKYCFIHHECHLVNTLYFPGDCPGVAQPVGAGQVDNLSWTVVYCPVYLSCISTCSLAAHTHDWYFRATFHTCLPEDLRPESIINSVISRMFAERQVESYTVVNLNETLGE